ncbi:Hint domain-containing protein [Acidisoma cladoniae]|uniref:Hint domain-containing protein n=1 Tax=Acidisoma cladoniae TaxID=3040935 RepID=UPI00254AD2D6|nr:Hint domain-containing protein [Acidisoma sp. PAMC 29798]
MDVTSTGADGLPGMTGQTSGASGTGGAPGLAGGAEANSGTDTTNTAEAVGGDGGRGGNGAANNNPNQGGGRAGDGGSGGYAAADAATITASAGGNSASATAAGGTAGDGGIGGLPSALGGMGGVGGDAKANASAGNTAGAAAATATAYGGTGGTSQYDTPQYDGGSYTGNLYSGGNGASLSGSTATATGTTQATATVKQVGGAGGAGPAGGNGGSSTLTNAVSGTTDGGTLILSQTADGGTGGDGGPFAGPGTASGGAATSDLTLNDTSSTQVSVTASATGGDGGEVLASGGGLTTGGPGGDAASSAAITGTKTVYEDIVAIGGYGGADGGTGQATGIGTAATFVNVYVSANGGGANTRGGAADASATGTGAEANVTALASGGVGEDTGGNATAKATGIGLSGTATADAGGSYENGLVGAEDGLDSTAVAVVSGTTTAYAAQSQGDALGAFDTTDQVVSADVLDPTSATNGTDLGTGDTLLLDTEEGGGNYGNLTTAVTNTTTVTGHLDFSAYSPDADVLLDLHEAALIGTGVTEVDLFVAFGQEEVVKSFSSGAAAEAFFSDNVINLGTVGDLEDLPSQLTNLPVAIELKVIVDAPDSGFYADMQVGVGAAPAGPDVFEANKAATSGAYLWSDAANWTNGLPTNGDAIEMAASGTDDIAGLSLKALSLSPPTGTAGEVSTLTVTDGLSVTALTIAASSEIAVTGSGAADILTLGSIAVTGTGAAPTLYATGAGAVIDDTETAAPALDYIAQDSGKVELAGAPAAGSELTYIGGGTFALAAPGAAISAELADVGAGDVLELPGTTVSSVTLGTDSLTVTTDIGTYSFTNVTYDVGGIGSYSVSHDSATGLEAITFGGTTGVTLSPTAPGNVTIPKGAIISGGADGISNTTTDATSWTITQNGTVSGTMAGIANAGTLSGGWDILTNGPLSGGTDGIVNTGSVGGVGWDLETNASVDGGDDGIANTGTVTGGWDLATNQVDGGTDGIANTGTVTGGWDVQTNQALDGGSGDGIVNAGTVTGGWDLATNQVDGGDDGIVNTGMVTGGWDLATNEASSGDTDGIANSGTVAGGWDIQVNQSLDGGTDGIANTGTVSGGWDIQVNQSVGDDTSGASASGSVTGGKIGILDKNGGGTVANAGSITGKSDAGIVMSNGGIVDNAAGGSILGGIDGIDIGNGGTIDNAGTIIGTTGDAVDFSGATGHNKLVVHAGAIFAGAVTAASGGSNTLELAQQPSVPSAGTLSGLGTQFTGFTTVTVDAGGDWDLAGANTLASGATLTDLGTLTAEGAFTNDGLIITDPSTLTFDGAVTGSGTIEVGVGSDVIFGGGVSQTETVTFVGDTGTVTLGDVGGFQASISGFVAGDAVTAADLVGASASFSGNADQSTLSFTSGTAALGSLSFTGSYTAQDLHFDSTAGTVSVEVVAPCFAEGTRILTIRGYVAVEELRIGDRVLTLDRADRPITWLGQRSIDCRRHASPDKVNPVQIQADAFAPAVPKRDVFLSPDHAVFVEGVLIPIKHLINGTTIRQVPAGIITYFHVELPEHAVVLAEGLPSESYLDTGDRTAFAGGVVKALHPAWGSERHDISLLMDALGYAPLRVTGPEVTRARALLAARSDVQPEAAPRHAGGPNSRLIPIPC